MKHKWKNLRDSYKKYIRYLKRLTGYAKKYRNWPWAAHLKFLKDTVVPRTIISNVSQTDETSHNDETQEKDETDSEFVTSPYQMQPSKKKTQTKRSYGRRSCNTDIP